MKQDKKRKGILKRGSSASTADMAPEGKPHLKRRDEEEPCMRAAEPLAENEKPDQLADKEKEGESRQEALLDEAIEETFPGSDPISPKHVT